MRIILIGQAVFAEKTLEKLVNKGEEVLAVFCPPDAPGGKFDPIKQRALQLNVLASEIAPKVKAAWIAIVIYRARSCKHLDAIPGARLWRRNARRFRSVIR